MTLHETEHQGPGGTYDFGLNAQCLEKNMMIKDALVMQVVL